MDDSTTNLWWAKWICFWYVHFKMIATALVRRVRWPTNIAFEIQYIGFTCLDIVLGSKGLIGCNLSKFTLDSLSGYISHIEITLDWLEWRRFKEYFVGILGLAKRFSCPMIQFLMKIKFQQSARQAQRKHARLAPTRSLILADISLALRDVIYTTQMRRKL